MSAQLLALGVLVVIGCGNWVTSYQPKVHETPNAVARVMLFSKDILVSDKSLENEESLRRCDQVKVLSETAGKIRVERCVARRRIRSDDRRADGWRTDHVPYAVIKGIGFSYAEQSGPLFQNKCGAAPSISPVEGHRKSVQVAELVERFGGKGRFVHNQPRPISSAHGFNSRSRLHGLRFRLRDLSNGLLNLRACGCHLPEHEQRCDDPHDNLDKINQRAPPKGQFSIAVLFLVAGGAILSAISGAIAGKGTRRLAFVSGYVLIAGGFVLAIRMPGSGFVW